MTSSLCITHVTPSTVSLGCGLLAVCWALVIPATVQAQTTRRISVSSTNVEANGASRAPSVSADGRFVAFESDASNLVEGDTNGHADVFVRDLQSGATTLVSLDEHGVQFPLGADTASISADGRYVAFRAIVTQQSFQAQLIYLRDVMAGVTYYIGAGFRPRLGAGARFVAFESNASSLVPSSAIPLQIYLHDRLTGSTTLISPLTTVNAYTREPTRTFSEGLSMSADGRYYAFQSVSPLTDDFMRVFLFDRVTGMTTLAADHRYYSASPLAACVDENSACISDAWAPGLSPSGRVLAYGTDKPLLNWPFHSPHLAVFDRPGDSRVHLRVTDGDEDRGDLPGYLVDVKTLSLSGDGRFIGLQSTESSLVPSDTNDQRDVFLFDRQTSQTHRVSVATGGGEGVGGPSRNPALSATGRHIAFESAATGLVFDDTNGVSDVFVREWSPPGGGDVAPCLFNVSLPPATVPTTGATITVTVSTTPSCSWEAVSASSWMVPSVSGSSDSGIVTLTVEPNPGGERTGVVAIANHVLRVKQLAAPCTLSAQPSALSFGVAGGTATVAISAPPGCLWSASYAPWVAVAGAPHTGDGTLTYTVPSNMGGPARQITLTVAPFGAGTRAAIAISQAGVGNSTPVLIAPIPAVTVDQDAAPSTIALAGVFSDPDAGDALSLAVTGNTNATLVTPTVIATQLALTYSPGQSGAASLTIRATDRAGLTASTTFSVTVRPRTQVTNGPPGSPQDFQATAIGNSVHLRWVSPHAGPAATGYLLEVGLTPTAFTLATLPFGDVRTFTATAPSGTYHVRLRATNAQGESPPTAAVRLDVGCVAPPGSPTGLEAALNNSQIRLRWSAASGNVERYVVEAGTVTGARDLASVPIPAPTLSIDAVAPPGQYFLRVHAANACGVSQTSAEIFIVVGSAAMLPSAPTGLTAAFNGTTVMLSWNAPAEGTTPTGYVLEAGTAPGLANVARIVLGPARSLVVPGVPPGTFHVRVRALNAAGIGTASADTILARP